MRFITTGAYIVLFVLIFVAAGLNFSFTFPDKEISTPTAQVDIDNAIEKGIRIPANFSVRWAEISLANSQPETNSETVVEEETKTEENDTENISGGSETNAVQKTQPARTMTQTVTPKPLSSNKPVTSIKEYQLELVENIADLTNEVRKQNGLSALTSSSLLNDMAKSHSSYILSQGKLTHTGAGGCDMSCRFEEVNHTFMTWGENIASIDDLDSYTADELAREFMRLWLESSHHRDNILSDKYTFTGIATSVKGDELYVAVEFAAL